MPSKEIEVGLYYAVDYVTHFYYGRVVSTEDGFVDVKFLHSANSATFDWPRRDNIEKYIPATFVMFQLIMRLRQSKRLNFKYLFHVNFALLTSLMNSVKIIIGINIADTKALWIHSDFSACVLQMQWII